MIFGKVLLLYIKIYGFLSDKINKIRGTECQTCTRYKNGRCTDTIDKNHGCYGLCNWLWEKKDKEN